MASALSKSQKPGEPIPLGSAYDFSMRQGKLLHIAETHAPRIYRVARWLVGCCLHVLLKSWTDYRNLWWSLPSVCCWYLIGWVFQGCHFGWRLCCLSRVFIMSSLLLTRRQCISYTAVVCLLTARHQNAAVTILQQVLITLSVGRHTMAFLQ